jgi:UDP-glucuronate decarboxylase
MPKGQVIKKSSLIPTALISGGAGFIGSHLAQALLDKNARVVALDNFKTGKQVNISHLLNNANFALYDVDINDGIPDEIDSVDYVIHLAGLEEYLYSKNFLNLDSLLTNSLGVKNLLDLAKKSESKFILASTIDVYQGRMSQLSISKYFGFTTLEDNKYSLAEAKRFAEAMVWQYFNRYQLDARIVRLPEIYGPNMNLDSTGSIGSFIRDLIERRDITVRGDGTDKEYYLYIEDAIAGILKALFNPITRGNIYSLVSKEPTSVLEAAYLIKSLADAEINVEFSQIAKEPKQQPRIPDTYNLGDLNWEARTLLKDGVIKTLEWFGYSINQYAFKPAKFLQKPSDPTQTSTLADIKIPTQNPVRPGPAVQTLPRIQQGSDIYRRPLMQTQPQKTTVDPADIVARAVLSKFPTPEPQPRKSIEQSYTPPVRQQVPPRAYIQPQMREQPQPQFPPVVRRDLPPFLKKNYVKILKEQSQKVIAFIASKIPANKKIVKSTPTLATKGKQRFAPIFSVLAVLAAGILTFIVFPLYTISANIKEGAQVLAELQTSGDVMDAEVLKNDLEIVNKKFSQARFYLVKVKWIFKVTGRKQEYNSAYRLFSSVMNFSKAGNDLAAVVRPMQSLWEIIRPDTDKVMDPGYFDSAKFSIMNARNSIKLALADYKGVDLSVIPKSYRNKIQDYGTALAKLDNGLELGSALVAEMPTMLGATSEKKYLIWFQNSNEIRPTGGFIGSYGILKFKGGKLQDLVIDDIYNPDGQVDVRGIEIAPPLPISELLKEPKLYLRNSNWSPDFPKSAAAFDELYYRVTGEVIDGYMAMDLNFARDLLKVTGPIFLAAYEEEINADNLYERTQYHSDFNYQDGSSQKRSFLTLLGSKLMEKIFSAPKDKIPALLSEVEESLNQRHLMFYTTNGSLNAFLKERNWDGSLIETNGDYLSVINANLGGTKANFYVKNKYSYTLDSLTRDGLLRASLAIEYKHTGENSAWPGGPYTNYVRVLTQDGTKLTSAKFLYSDNTSLDISERMAVNKEGKYNSFETTFVLEPKQTLTLVVTYDLPTNLAITKDMKNYSMLWQKQPGTREDEYVFRLNAPFGMSIMEHSNNLLISSNSAENMGILSKDLRYTVALQ